MASAKVFNQQASEVGSVDLPDAVFGVPLNSALVHDVAVALQANRRQGNAETKTRRDVSGGGRKPYKQKGTGSARHGSTREPQMRHGGIVFGPHKRSYRQHVPVAFKRLALCCALSERLRKDALCVLDGLACPAAKTKPFAQMVARFSPEGKKTLFVMPGVDGNVTLSARNLQTVVLRTASDLNTLDVLDAARVIVLQDAVTQLEQRLTAPRRRKEAVA